MKIRDLARHSHSTWQPRRMTGRMGLATFVFSFYFTAAYAVDYTGGNFNDPFFYEETGKDSDKLDSVAPQGSMILQGVLWNVEPPTAIISGQIVTRGAKIGDAEVIQINQEGVKMLANGNEFMLKMELRRAE